MTAWLIVWVVTTVPITAMPRALPTWRTVVLVPLATPDLGGGMSDRMTLVSWVTDEADAQAVADQPGSEVAEGEVWATRRPPCRCRPTVCMARPSRITGTVPMRLVSRPPMGAPTRMDEAVGQHPQAVLQGGEVLALLQEQGQGEAQAELAHGQDGGGEQAVAERAVLEQPELEQGAGVAALAARARGGRRRRAPRTRRPGSRGMIEIGASADQIWWPARSMEAIGVIQP